MIYSLLTFIPGRQMDGHAQDGKELLNPVLVVSTPGATEKFVDLRGSRLRRIAMPLCSNSQPPLFIPELKLPLRFHHITRAGAIPHNTAITWKKGVLLHHQSVNSSHNHISRQCQRLDIESRFITYFRDTSLSRERENFWSPIALY